MCGSVCLHARREEGYCTCVYMFDNCVRVCMCAKEETQEVRRQTGRQMDRQGQDPNPLHGHPAKIFNLKCSWHLRTKCIMDILLLL